MRLISIGRIYLLKSSEAERCILPDDAHQKPPARADCVKTAHKAVVHNPSTWRISKNTTHIFQYCSAKVPLGFSASKAPPSQASFSVCPCSKALSHLPVSKTLLQACIHPKRLSCSPVSKAALRDYLHPGHSFALAEPKPTLCVGLYPNRPLEPACTQSPFMPSRVQSSTSRLLESKAPLHDYSHPKPLISPRVQRSPSCPPESKTPLVSAQILTRI